MDDLLWDNVQCKLNILISVHGIVWIEVGYVCTHKIFIFVDNSLLKTSLAVIISAVGVVTSPGKLITSPLTVSQVRCVSVFYCLILATIIP